MRHPSITALKNAADRAWPHVQEAIELAEGRPFWQLPSDEVCRRPKSGTTGAALNRAWEECMRTDAIATALTHKLPHHKRPDLFPLVDGKTRPRLEPFKGETTGLWSVIHAELTANAGSFAALEAGFAELVNGEGDVPLQRLRLHDILLWLVATEKWDRAVFRGRATPEWHRYMEG